MLRDGVGLWTSGGRKRAHSAFHIKKVANNHHKASRVKHYCNSRNGPHERLVCRFDLLLAPASRKIKERRVEDCNDGDRNGNFKYKIADETEQLEDILGTNCSK